MTQDQLDALHATAAERAATLTPPVKPITVQDLHKRVAELEGHPLKGDETNEFHQKSNALHDKHGESRAILLEKLELAGIVSGDSVPLFLKLLDEYNCAGDDVPYEVCEAVGSGSERWPSDAWTEAGDGTAYPGDPNVNASIGAVAGGLPTQDEADAVVAKAQAEEDARKAETNG
jgi:hypothetical protein